MHIDEDKIFDKRNIAMNIRNGVITRKDYEIFLSKLTDSSEKLFNPEEISIDSGETESRKESEISSKKRGPRKKVKGK